MPERFTESLRAAGEAGWSHPVQHRFVNELFGGAVPDAVMARYLIQDHRFLDSFLVLLGAALASADTFAARLRLVASSAWCRPTPVTFAPLPRTPISSVRIGSSISTRPLTG